MKSLVLFSALVWGLLFAIGHNLANKFPLSPELIQSIEDQIADQEYQEPDCGCAGK